VKSSTLYALQTIVTPETIAFFQKLIYQYYRLHGRSFQWRETYDPYNILVSEIMLQQTQTSRVEKKYPEFISRYPDFKSLAQATVSDVIRMWKGLGYNRRALALREIAHTVIADYNGELPDCPDDLLKLPGVGRYTAAAVATFAFNRPEVFIDTNIRTVFLYFFYHGKENIYDQSILPLIEMTLDRENPRKWYYALFDYGAMLKMRNNVNASSVHYRKQNPFKGSNREVRGKIISLLLNNSALTYSDIGRSLELSTMIVRENLDKLQKEGFITIIKDRVRLNDVKRFNVYE
jgi:A/G-specific adenine glycosylase